MKKFAMTGVAGYIAPRHLKAIKETGNFLIAALDPHDSVGILDSYFPDADFFTKFERFERKLESLRSGSSGLDFLTVCSPNYLHDTHIRLGLHAGADVICEKPLVILPKNLDYLEKIERETGKKVYTVMQLRAHPALIEFKRKLGIDISSRRPLVYLTYITRRGRWYSYSWKGDDEKSGGLATNIGIHLFDLLIWIFGNVKRSSVFLSENTKMSGMLELVNADVAWYLSIDEKDLPASLFQTGKGTFRSIRIGDDELDFTEGFTDLHNRVYNEILSGHGLGINDARPSIELVDLIRSSKPVHPGDLAHPFISGRLI
jgi:UDP-N-acetyl-2-amino-2-deoxyglucuronate dehydrogenase